MSLSVEDAVGESGVVVDAQQLHGGDLAALVAVFVHVGDLRQRTALLRDVLHHHIARKCDPRAYSQDRRNSSDSSRTV